VRLPLRGLATDLINAQEKERKRIAHELHDSLAAQLAAIKYRLERKHKIGESPENPITLDEIIRDVQNANRETRRTMANFRPSLLDDLGIVVALSWFSRETEKAYPGTFIEYPGTIQDSEVPEELKIVLFRVVQESVTNAVRHGESSRIRIGLEKKDGWLRLTVEDNGKGCDAARLGDRSGSHGIGLNSLEQRIDSTGGIFCIRSTPGDGTTVRAEWKID
jgi:signal transduction histidine kinase